ncbi:MAG: hypothetical protein L6254_01790 [Candidatus Omnitrophica bacterium]|nr:hypothetical protein [Candidatus Omnitrophota bacterium]
MSLIWVSHPWVQPPNSPNLLKSIEEQQIEFGKIDGLGSMSSCRLCGSKEGLTKEHSPSKSSVNKSKLITLSIAPIITRFLHWQGNIIQGGSKHESLCRNCNNKTGSWYNPTYVKFVRTCVSIANVNNAYKAVNISANNIYPSRLLKQALTHIIATCQPGLCVRYSDLKEIILNKEKLLDISPFKIGMFIRVNKGGRHSGITIFVDTAKEQARLIAEFSFWPLGWVMTFDNSPLDGTLDVTNWSSISGNEKTNLNISVPCQWCVSPYPGDFRSPDKVFERKRAGA